MEIYLVIILFLIFIGHFDLLNLKREQKWVFLAIMFIILVFQDGFRWETGTDWANYKMYFDNAVGFVRPPAEIGYKLLNDLIHLVSRNYSVFLIVHAIIIYSLYLKSIYDYTEFPLITLLCFYCTFIGYMGMNRQHIALAVCLYSFRYVISRQFWKFVFFVTIASSFHLAAVPFLIIYFLDRRISRDVYVTIFMVAVMLNPIIVEIFRTTLAAIPSKMLIFERLRIRIGPPGGKIEILNPMMNVFFGLVKRLIIFLAIYLNVNKLKEKVPYIELMLNIYFISIIVYIIFNNTVQTFVGRGNLFYGSMFEIFLLPYLIYLFSKKDMSRLIFYAVIVIIMIMNAFRSIPNDLFSPYKGIFVNSEYYRKMR